MSRSNRYRRPCAFAWSLAAVLASCALCGCALSGREDAPPIATFVLQGTTSSAPSSNTATDLVLKVATPGAAPAYASSKMAYIEQPYRVDYFARNEWADPPSRMLQTLLTQQLSNCGLFRYVVADSVGVDDVLRLDSELIELVQAFDESSSDVRVSIRFDLVDVARRTIVFSETLSASEPATRDPYAGVVAANTAVQRVIDQLVANLREPVTSLRASNP